MPVPIGLVVFALNSLLKLSSTVNRALIDAAVDKDALFPDVREIFVGDRAKFNLALVRLECSHLVSDGGGVAAKPGPYADLWEKGNSRLKPGIDMEGPRIAELKVAIVQCYAAGIAAGTAFTKDGKDNPAVGLLVGGADAEPLAGEILFRQWRKGTGPLPPWARIALSLADIAADYVAANPGQLGVGKKLSPVVSAFAAHLAEKIPDTGNFGPRRRFGERLLGIVFELALQAIHEKRDGLFRDQDIRDLLDVFAVEVIETFPDDASLETQIDSHAILKTIVGPAASAVLRRIAERPQGVLGSAFRPTKLAGKVISEIFKQTAAGGLASLKDKEGWEPILDAVLGIAVDHPELFVKSAGQSKDTAAIVGDLVSKVAKTLKDETFFSGQPDLKNLPFNLAAAALSSVAANAGRFARRGDAWEELAAKLVGQVLDALGGAARSGDLRTISGIFGPAMVEELGRTILQRLAEAPDMVVGTKAGDIKAVVSAVATAMSADEHLLLTKDNWLEIVRTALGQLALTPGLVVGDSEPLKKLLGAVTKAMAADKRLLLAGDGWMQIVRAALAELAATPAILVGRKHEELANVLSAVASAMAADKHFLLRREDWLEIARIALATAAANPGRLFGIDRKIGADSLANVMLSLLIGAASEAAESVAAGTAAEKLPVLYGNTLRQAILVLLDRYAGRPELAVAQKDAIRKIAAQLTKTISDAGLTFGAAEWLLAFTRLVDELLAKGAVPDVTLDALKSIVGGSTS